MHSKEKEMKDKVTQMRAKMQSEIKERKAIELRLKDNKMAISQRQDEITGLTRALNDKDNEKRKIRTELDKVRKSRDLLE